MLKTIETLIGHWVTIIKAHERIVLALIAAFVLLHYADKAYDAYGNHLKANTAADNVRITQIEQTNTETASQLAALKATVDANAKIANAKIAVAQQKLAQAQQTDAVLPLPDLSKHWEDMLQLPTGSITPQPSGLVAVTTDAAHLTVSRLENVDSLETQLAASNDKLNGCTDVRVKQDTQIAGLTTDIAAEKKGRADDAKQAKHDIRSAYWRGFKHGVIVTVVVAVGIKVATVLK